MHYAVLTPSPARSPRLYSETSLKPTPGFPFTSAQWPWPLANDEPMQPIAQVNLESAGKLLGESMGDGLLQCWASAMFGHPTHWDPLLRIIPKADLLQTIDSRYPQGGRRNRYKSDSRREGLGGPGEWWTKPRVEWIPMGGMFPDPIEAMVGLWSPENLGFSELRDALSFAAAIHQTGIPLTVQGCFGQMEGVRLGGFPDAGHVYPSEWLDWETGQNSSLSFTTFAQPVVSVPLARSGWMVAVGNSCLEDIFSGVAGLVGGGAVS